MASSGDTIRVLVATDNHVGVNENNPVIGDDSWRTFDEILNIARSREVDMVLLAGDLFHETKPSKSSLYHVTRSLRQNCLGDKPCELQMLSDGSEHFDANFTHANYEDMDINVSIPVFSIHGNHDDPTDKGHFAALDILQMSGLINYYGKAPESDKINVKPVLLQKGRTKLALYGLSNVRDQRMYHTFREGNVKFFRPSQQKNNWFNLLSVHQNHHKYHETGYLPEKFLPSFMQLVVWGHEHECLIEPRKNFEQGFYVMQPGSSVATSLVPAEAVQKHVAILSITGKDFESEKIPLKSVRPLIVKSIALAEEPGMVTLARKENNRTLITKHITIVVNSMIDEVRKKWLQDQDPEQRDVEMPLPIVRLNIDYAPPEQGGRFDIENPSRISNRFADKVANTDIVTTSQKKKAARKTKDGTIIPNQEELSLENIKVEKLVREYLQAQSLTILPQNLFGDAVSEFIEKSDKHAMESFVAESLKDQVKNLLGAEQGDMEADDIGETIDQFRADIEAKFAAGQLKRKKRAVRVKPKPPEWDSDLDGPWEEQMQALVISDAENGEDGPSPGSPASATAAGAAKSRGRGRGAKSAGTSSRAAKATATTSKAAQGAKNPARGGRRGATRNDKNDADGDVVMVVDDDEESDAFETLSPTKPSTSSKKPPARSTRGKQSTLNFSSQAKPPSRDAKKPKPKELSDDEISDDDDDDDDAFEQMSSTVRQGRRR